MVLKTIAAAAVESDSDIPQDYNSEEEAAITDSEGDAEDSGTGSEAEGSNDDGESGNAGWADSLANVLKTSKPKTGKTLMLSRAAKNVKTEKAKKSYDFEIEGEDGEEKPDKKVLDEEIAKKPKSSKLQLRVKPTVKDIEKERALKKIATRGVVQLFNAVRIQQKELDEEIKKAGKLDHKKDAVLNNINKRKFLDVLMSGQRAKSENIDNPVKDEIKEEEDEDEVETKKTKSEWSVLRDDFMTNKKLKHWDQEDSSDSGGEGEDKPGGGESSDSDS